MSFCDVCHHQNDFGFEKRVRNFSFVNFEKETSHPKHICIDWKKKNIKGRGRRNKTRKQIALYTDGKEVDYKYGRKKSLFNDLER